MEISPTASLLNLLRKKDYEKNVTSTLNILNYIIKKNRKIKLVYMSTISVFGNSKLKKLKENDKTLPISTYSKNKILARKLCFNYCQNSILTPISSEELQYLVQD